ncbi:MULTISPECIES: hypothetical protein [Rhodococcus]|uniref:hypothetical protein n=1 Tax=Rhodococcus TaxID=1827 RepID=UPI000E6B17E6|nr:MULTISPECIES: hypothetical protein [Rhodococcus]AXY49362.1 hypothetical protein YT1_p10161 [Rhodococcus ruber]
MADTERIRRFRRNRSPSTGNAAAQIDPPTDRGGTPPKPAAASQPRPAPVQARQDVVDVAAFIVKVDTERSQGRPAPRPQPMHNILGAFRGAPETQTTVQILAAAATARHFGGENSAAARTWEKLAQDNAARLDAMRAQQYRQDQTRYVQAQLPPDEIDRHINERIAADRDTDKRAFAAAGALALSYVAVKSLPSFDKLADLSREHLTVDEPTAVPRDVASRLAGQTHGAQTREATPDTGSDLDKSPSAGDTSDETERDVQADTAAEADPDADVSDQLGQVAQPAPLTGPELGKPGAVLERAGRGIATAIGPVNGDEEVAPPLSPVDLSQLSHELLSAIGAAMSGHPRSVTEMLNFECRPDHTDEMVFAPDMGLERSHEATFNF